MAQVSYGTITITDTNDIERIYTVYAKSANNTTVPAAAAANWKESISEAPGTGNYIWQRTVVQKSGTLEKTYSDPVCLTGEEGTDGRGITSITIKYGTSADWNTQPSSWYDNTPEYSSSTSNYWTQTTISYTSGSPTVKVTQDKALTQAIHDSVMANSLAQSANENANGAMGQAASNVNSVTRLWWSQATATPVPSISTIITDGAANRRGAWSNIRPTDDEAYPYYFYCDQTITGGGVASWSTVTLDTSTLSKYEIIATNVRTQNFFKGQDTTYDGWFASGRSSDNGLKENDAETYYYNARFGATHIALGYNKTPVIDLDGSNGTINIYRFPTIDGTSKKVTSAGALGMKLSATDLKFYNSNGALTSTFGDTISLASNGASITIGSSQNEHITIDTNGLKIYGNYSYNNNGTSASMYGLLGSFGNSVQIGPLNTGHITLSTTGATFYDSADTTIGVIGNTDLYYSTESYEEIVEVNWVSGETFTYDKQFNYDTIINSVLIAVKNGDTIDWSSAQTVTSPWGRVYINLNDTMVPISISPSAVTGRTNCIFSTTSTNPTTDTTLAFKINHTPSMPGPHYSFGIGSIASGTGSFAAGVGIQAVGPYQMVLGRYNKKDLDASFIIGNGTDNNNRSNLFVVDENGNLRVNNGFQIYNNDETDSIAEFGTTARIGKINNSHFLIGGSSLQAYNSSNQLYFEVSSPETTETQILNSTSGILDLSNISWNTNFDLIFTIYFAGYSTTLAPTFTFTNLFFDTEFMTGYGPSANIWHEAADYSGEQLPSGSASVGGRQTAAGEKALNYNITITGNGLTFDYASVTIIQKTATITDKVFLTFGSRKENSVKGLFSSAMGLNIAASGEYTHAEGRDTTASGDYSHAKGYNTIATGIASYAEGDSTRASGKAAHAEGMNTIASGNYSHAEGDHTIASGNGSHVEGMNTVASGNYSHAEGKNTTASGLYSHTEGFYTVASGNYSHASGCQTIATADYQTVFGKYNLEDSEAMFIVGNGTNDNNRSNLMVIGNNYVNIGGNNSSNISIGLDGISAYKSDGVPYFQIGLQDATIAQKATANVTFGRGLSGFGVYLAQHPEFSQLYNNLEEGETFDVSFISKTHWYRDSTGQDGYNSRGYTVTLTKGTPFSWTTPNSQTTVAYSVTYVPSNNGQVSVSFSYAYWDNYYPSITGWSWDTCSLQFKCLVNTPAPSYSFGINTDVSKKLGFAIGDGTIPSDIGFACGKYNISDTNNNYVLIIGNGTSSTPSNALTVDWNGNLNISGGLNTGGALTTTGDITVGNNKITLNGTSGNITTTGGITVNGNLTIGGSQTITIGSGTTISGTVNATGQYQRHGNTYIVTDSRSKDNVRVPGTSSSDNSYVTITVPSINKDGYTPIAVVNYNFQNATTNGSNSSNIMCYGCSFDTSNNTASVKVRNLTSSDARIKVTVRILYRAV